MGGRARKKKKKLSAAYGDGRSGDGPGSGVRFMSSRRRVSEVREPQKGCGRVEAANESHKFEQKEKTTARNGRPKLRTKPLAPTTDHNRGEIWS